ncbi:MAG: OsmC family protein [bacterium]
MSTGRTHRYAVDVTWTGNRGTGTSSYRDYGREHDVSVAGKPLLVGSSDPAFRGDPGRWNPEELLVTALAQCHLLSYLHLAVKAGVVVVDYTDSAIGTMVQDDVGDGGQFAEVILRPVVTVAEAAMADAANALHADVAAVCFITRSVNFPVHHEPTVSVAAPADL